jgi:hypothetical protein
MGRIRDYQQTDFEHILRMPRIEFLGRFLVTILKEEERVVNHRRDGKINSSNPDIGTGQKASTL